MQSFSQCSSPQEALSVRWWSNLATRRAAGELAGAPYLATSLASTPPHSRTRMGKVGLAFFSSWYPLSTKSLRGAAEWAGR
jgi:hypothetical protein